MAKKGKKDEDLDLVDEDLDEDDDDDDDDDTPRKKGGCIIGIIIFTLIIATLVAILGFNAGGIRDKYLRPFLEKVPIVKNLLPPLKEENQQEEPQISKEQETINSLTQEIEKLNQEIKRLKEFENNQLQFKTQKEQFDKMIALNDPKAYSNFYESIAPENAEKLYQETIKKVEVDKEFKSYISTFENMKKESASKILEELLMTDTDLVITILNNLSSEKRAEILSTMTPKNAAACSKLLSPDAKQ